jgi:valyl-tRNA synthetase
MHLKEPGGDIPGGNALSLPDRWILSRLRQVTGIVDNALETYKFNEAAGTLYNFIWHEFCDWYLEAVKPVLYSVLWRVLRDSLVLLHPIMPFVTEEIWSKLPGTTGSIMRAAFPEADDLGQVDPQAESHMQLAIDVISAVRNIRGEMNLPPSRPLSVQVQDPDAEQRETVKEHAALIRNLAKIDNLSVSPPGEKPKSSAAAIVSGATLFVDLHGIIDFDKETARLEKEIAKIEKELGGLDKKLSNPGFLNKAPEAVVAGVREKHETLNEKRAKLENNLDMIRRMATA